MAGKTKKKISGCLQDGGPLAHGGPHWDVIDPDNNHLNVTPGGGIR